MKYCHYYVTLRCNAACEFCQVWRLRENQNISGSETLPAGRQGEEQRNREAEITEILPKLREMRIKGVKHLNITGGEPLLREDLPEILKAAKKLGFEIELTTNGILYNEKAKGLVGLLDRLYFSIDYPFEEEHDRSRGVECFNAVVSAAKKAKELGENAIFIFTLTRDNVRFLPEMVDLSQRLNVPVLLSPVYDFFGTQGFASITIDSIKYYSRKKNVFVNLALLEFIRAGGNNLVFPRCRAKETTVTLLPDGSRASPCFFNQKGEQGKEAVCSSCIRSPYMLPSFAKRLDRYFWFDLYSKWQNLRKEIKK